MTRRASGSMTAGAIAAILVAAQVPAQGDPADELVQLESVLQRAVRAVSPSVVTVDTFGGARRDLRDETPPSGEPVPDEQPSAPRPKRPSPPGFLQAQGATTGVVLTRDGWILVSRFALNFDPTTVVVTLADGRRCEARRAGQDTSRGLALLKIDVDDLPVPEFARPEDARVGQWTFVVGRAFGRTSPSVHMGILSAVKRLFGRALQTDAWTSPANYGGPVIDIDGRVLGIAVPLSRSGRDAGVELYDSGIGFAATIADIGPLLARMQSGETLHRGWLGIVPDHDHLGPGARVLTVTSGSAADGVLERGDLIATVDGTPIRNGFHLVDAVNARMSGDELVLGIERAGEAREVRVVLQALPERQREPTPLAEEAGVPPWEEDEPQSGR